MLERMLECLCVFAGFAMRVWPKAVWVEQFCAQMPSIWAAPSHLRSRRWLRPLAMQRFLLASVAIAGLCAASGQNVSAATGAAQGNDDVSGAPTLLRKGRGGEEAEAHANATTASAGPIPAVEASAAATPGAAPGDIEPEPAAAPPTKQAPEGRIEAGAAAQAPAETAPQEGVVYVPGSETGVSVEGNIVGRTL